MFSGHIANIEASRPNASSYNLPPDIENRLSFAGCSCLRDWEDLLIYYAEPTHLHHPYRNKSVGPNPTVNVFPMAKQDLCGIHDRRQCGTATGNRYCHHLILKIAKKLVPEMVKENKALQEERRNKGARGLLPDSMLWQEMDKCVSPTTWLTESVTEPRPGVVEEDLKSNIEIFMDVKEDWIRRLSGAELVEKGLKAAEYHDTLPNEWGPSDQDFGGRKYHEETIRVGVEDSSLR